MFDKVLLSEKVAANIKELIVKNQYKPGSKLPNEMELAGQLNVSRSTVREAIKILMSKNILVIKRGRGTYVCERPGVATDPLGVTFMNKKDLLLYLFETRLLIEPAISELAAIRATEKNLEDLEGAFQKIVSFVNDGRNHTEADTHFHNIIAKSTQNPILQNILPIINDSIKEGYLETRDIPQSGDMVIKDHKNILQAIQKRNPSLAKNYMSEHIQNGIRQIENKK